MSLSVRPEVSGIVLAGGASRRFGSDKLLAQLEGRPLLEHAIEALRPHVAEVLVAIGSAGSPPDVGSLDPAVCIVRDARSGLGPLAGLGAGLAAATRSVVLVVGGDMPAVRAPVLELLLSALDGPSPDGVPFEAAALVVAGALRPLPCALRLESAQPVAQRLLRGGVPARARSPRALLAELRTAAIVEERWRRLDPTGVSLVDVDTLEDLGRLARDASRGHPSETVDPKAGRLPR